MCVAKKKGKSGKRKKETPKRVSLYCFFWLKFAVAKNMLWDFSLLTIQSNVL